MVATTIMAGTAAMRVTATTSRCSGVCFWWNLLLAVPTVALSTMFASILGYSLPGMTWLGWVSPLLGTAIYLWGGGPSSPVPCRRSALGSRG